MPELDGFAVCNRIGVEQMPATIFVTAYDQYALAAFNANALDYVLKPFGKARLDRGTESLASAFPDLSTVKSCDNCFKRWGVKRRMSTACRLPRTAGSSSSRRETCTGSNPLAITPVCISLPATVIFVKR